MPTQGAQPKIWNMVRAIPVYVFGFSYLLLQMPLLLVIPFTHRKFHNWQSRSFAYVILTLVRVFSGLSHKIEGEENFPPEACLVVSNHQSAWETVFFAGSKRYIVSILKQELLWVPIFGMTTYFFGHVLINRRNRLEAIRKIITQGTKRIEQGYDVLVFPEGTRVSSKALGQFSSGMARLSIAANAPIVPVAHNAGLFWPRASLGKRPGTINLRYGKPIYPDGLSVGELTELVKSRIAEMLSEMPGATNRTP